MKIPEKIVRQDVWVAKTHRLADQPIKEIEKLMRELDKVDADVGKSDSTRYSI